MKKNLCVLGAFLFLACYVSPALALTDSEQAAQSADRLYREQQIRQNEQRLQDERSARERTKIEVPLPQPPKSKGGACRDIKAITLQDAKLIPVKKQKELVKPFEGRCLGVNEIQQLLADVTGYYIKLGYATARAYIPEQDLTSGTLKILIVEGVIKELKLEDAGKHSINMNGAFPGVVGKTLNLRDFEQGLDQVNRLVSNNATLDIQPGEAPGESVVVIKNQPKFPLNASVTSDNYGSRGTGRIQGGATVTANNISGLNEMLSYTRRQSIPADRFNQNSESNNVFFSIPYGYTTLSFGYSDSQYESQVITGGGAVLALEGDSRNIYGKIDSNIWRSQTDKWNVSAMITQKTSSNFAAGQKLEVSSRTLSVLDLDTEYSMPLAGGSFSVTSGVALGTLMFGALNDMEDLSVSSPKAQFRKLKLGVNFTLPFEVIKHSATFSSSITGQYSFDTLYGSEQISIGGPYSVRGFYATSLANDHGYYLKNDLSFLQPLGDVKGIPIKFKPYVGLDIGSVVGVADKTPNGTLIGSAVGFSVIGGPALFDIFTAKGFVHPDLIRDEGMSSFARISISF